MRIRAISPDWVQRADPSLEKVVEAEMTQGRVSQLNEQGYNIYYFPNSSSVPVEGYLKGEHIDTFDWVFVDMDLKEGKYKTKDEFIEALWKEPHIPTKIVNSGNGVHAYWRVKDLDAMSYLRLQRRLIRFFNTDVAVAKLVQLMRLPGYMNTKSQDNPKPCIEVSNTGLEYTCEQLDAVLPTITLEDEQYCQTHFNNTYSPKKVLQVKDRMPTKFAELLHTNVEVKKLWSATISEYGDRSLTDWKLAHLMFANGINRDDALSVLIDCPKAISRSPSNRIAYAQGIVDKIWTYELSKGEDKGKLSQSVEEILSKGNDDIIKGVRFACSPIIDNTDYGFRLGQVMGLVAGSGVGKTSVALNMFKWFVERNPQYIHFFVPLEQPANEIAYRWKALCGDNTSLHSKVQVLSNYSSDGKFRHLSFAEIKEYILRFKSENKCAVGCVVIDHIGALKKQGSKVGEGQDLISICHEMKGFAVETNTFLVMQSQTTKGKAGIGDIELDKDAAFGTMYFESYCDYLLTMWQPLKRIYDIPDCPKVTAFKFCKIRNKNVALDKRQEDIPYLLNFNPLTGELTERTEEEEKSTSFWVTRATNKRKEDKKTDVVSYKSTRVGDEDGQPEASGNENVVRIDRTQAIS